MVVYVKCSFLIQWHRCWNIVTSDHIHKFKCLLDDFWEWIYNSFYSAWELKLSASDGSCEWRGQALNTSKTRSDICSLLWAGSRDRHANSIKDRIQPCCSDRRTGFVSDRMLLKEENSSSRFFPVHLFRGLWSSVCAFMNKWTSYSMLLLANTWHYETEF